MNNKAQGLSMNYIVVAALGLIIFVIILAMFSGNILDFVTGIKSCTNNGGSCVASEDACKQSSGSILFNTDCKKKESTPVCCVVTDPFKKSE